MSVVPGNAIAFGDFVLDPAAELLHRGQEVVHLTPKSFALLLQLIERAGSLVTRDEMFERHWRGQVVTEGALTRCIRELRTALGDDPQQPRYLETVHRRGFRFIAPLQKQPQPAERTAKAVATSDGLIGRAALLDDVSSVLRGVAGGQHGTLLEVSGEPGIGKSRFAAALAERGRALGMRVHAARAAEARGAPPLWLWIQVLRGMEGAAAATSPDLAALLPGFAHASASAATARSGTVDRERFDICQAIVARVCECAAEQPLFLLLEDLHAADAESLLVLTELARALPGARLFVAMTYRDVGAPRNEALVVCRSELASIVAEPQRVHLRGLDAGGVNEWLRAQIDESAAAALTPVALAKTGGNPLYLRELLAMPADAGGGRTPSSWAMHRPETVQQLLLRRVQLLDADTLAILTVAAVLGDDIEFDLLRRCASFEEATVARALQTAVSERLLVADALQELQWRFSHGLLRETLYDSIEPGPRAEYHRRVAAALEDIGDASGTFAVERLAFHYARATRSEQQRRGTARFLELAAERARTSFAHRESLRCYSALTDHVERYLPNELALCCRAWCGRAIAAGQCGQPREATAYAQRALAIARQADCERSFAQAVLTLCALQPAYPPMPELIALQDEALARLPADAHALRSRLLSERAYRCFVHGDMPRLKVDARLAIEQARRADDLRTLNEALDVLCYSFVEPADDDDWRAAYTERLTIARRLDDIGIEYLARMSRLEHILQVGPDAAAIDSELARIQTLVAQINTPTSRAAVLRTEAGLAIARGELERAWALAQQALQVGLASTDPGSARAHALLQFGALFGLKGTSASIRDDVEQDREVSHNSLMRAALIHLQCRTGDRRKARDMLDALAGNFDLPRDTTFGLALTSLSLTCVDVGTPAHAEWLVDMLAPYRGRTATAIAFFNAGCSSGYMAMLANMLGRQRESTELFEEALAMNARMGFSLWHADTALAYAAACARWGSAHDRRRQALEQIVSAFAAVSGVLPQNFPWAGSLKAHAAD